jgi:hypothetical protein
MFSPMPTPGRPAGPIGAAGPVDLPALATVLTVAVRWWAHSPRRMIAQARGRPAGAAFAVQFDHDLGAQGGVLLVAVHPGGQLLIGAFPGGEQAAVEGHHL